MKRTLAPRKSRGLLAYAGFIVTLLLVPLGVSAQSRPLNDTGVTFCGGATSGNTPAPCTSNPPKQDNEYGRDAAALEGTLVKVGGSAGTNGFDFTKIANNGSVLAASATLGSGPTDWACTRDNVTGLIWEVKTTNGLRSMNHTYTWFQTGSPDGNNGTASGGTCATTGRCDTEKFVEDVNTNTLCGLNDWRMPTIKELEGISDLSRVSPAIDPTYFPNTLIDYWWSGSPYANSTVLAWFVYSGTGHASYLDVGRARSIGQPVRLVRGPR